MAKVTHVKIIERARNVALSKTPDIYLQKYVRLFAWWCITPLSTIFQ